MKAQRYLSRVCAGVMILLAVGVFACQSETASNGGSEFPGPRGGRVISADEACVLTIPAGALDAPTEIRILETQAPDTTVFDQVSRAYRIEPVDLVFKKEVSIELFTNPQALPVGAKVSDILIFRDNDDGFWRSIAGATDPASNWARARSERLGSFSAGVALNGNPVFPGSPFNFGLVRVGETLSRTVIMRNTAEIPLDVYSVSFVNNDGFSLSDPRPTPFSILPEAPGEWTIVFAPKEQRGYSDVLRFETNDIGSEIKELTITGRGAGTGQAELSDDEIDFGTSYDTDASVRQVTLSNVAASGNLLVYAMKIDDGPFELVAPEEPMPWIIPAGGSLDLDCRFAPLAPGYYNADMVLYVDDLDQPELEVALFGHVQGIPDGDAESEVPVDGDVVIDGDDPVDGDAEVADGDAIDGDMDTTDGDAVDGDTDVSEADAEAEWEADSETDGDMDADAESESESEGDCESETDAECAP